MEDLGHCRRMQGAQDPGAQGPGQPRSCGPQGRPSPRSFEPPLSAFVIIIIIIIIIIIVIIIVVIIIIIFLFLSGGGGMVL